MKNWLQRNEKRILYVFLFFLPIQFGKHFWPSFAFVSGIRVDYLSPIIYVTDVIIVIWLFLWTLSNSKSLQQQSFTRKKILTSFLIIVFFCLNMLFSGNTLNVLYHDIKLLEYLFVAWRISVLIRDAATVRIIATIFSSGIVGESFLAISQYLNQGSLNGVFYFLGERSFTASTPGIANASLNGQLVLRPYGTFSHPNVLAGYLVIAMSFLLPFCFLKGKRPIHYFFIGVLFVGSFGLLLTLSRVALLVWSVTLCSVFVGYVYKKKNKLIVLQLLFAVAALGILFFLTPLFYRFSQLSLSDESVAQRLFLMQKALSLLSHSPFFGVGLGNFIPSLFLLEQPLSSSLLQPVHNIFFLIASETGLVGLGLALFFLGETFVQTRKNRNNVGRFLLSVICIIGVTDHYWLTLQQGQLLFAFVIGYCWVKYE